MADVFERKIMEATLRDIFDKYPEWRERDRQLNVNHRASKDDIIRRCIRSCELKAKEIITDQNMDISRRFADPYYLSVYSTECYKLFANIDPSGQVGNRAFGLGIINETIDATNVCLTSYEMFPTVSQPIIDEIDLRRKQHIQKKFTDKYKCPKCGGKKSEFEERIVRSADEPTVFKHTCLMPACGATWTEF